MSWKSQLVLLFSIALAAGRGSHVLGDQYGKAAKAWCKSKTGKAATCGWATADEIGSTLPNSCLYCGTMYDAPPSKLPGIVSNLDVMYTQYFEAASLGCTGRVVVRSVFKITQQPSAKENYFITSDLKGTSCSMVYMRHIDDEIAGEGGEATSVVRCELKLPSGPGIEAERALKSKEVNCYHCKHCNQGYGCPSKTGVWYSGSYTTKLPGCSGVIKTGTYSTHRMGFTMNPGTEILLAKFEVCNSPNCFDPAYEDAKLKSAKFCDHGDCS